MYKYDARPRYREYSDSQDRRSRREYSRRDYRASPPPRRAEQARPCKVLGVFGLSVHTTERDLYEVFSNYGRVRDIQMVYDNMSGTDSTSLCPFPVKRSKSARASVSIRAKICAEMLFPDNSFKQETLQPACYFVALAFFRLS